MNKGIFLIAGKLNKADNQILYWKDETHNSLEIGDFAIVENRNSFDLIEIVGVVSTTEEKANLFSKTCYKNMKNIIRIIKKEELIKEKENV